MKLHLGRGWMLRADRHGVALINLPALIESAGKSRSPSYWRGHADGRLYQRACGDDWDETTAAQTWLSALANRIDGRAVDLVDAADQLRAFALRGDQPPFAPELADAPIVTGESGALAPFVVDEPVHDSTLPAELGAGAPCRQCRMRGGQHKMDCTDPSRGGEFA